MVFQVNGTTILDMNRTFANSVFPATVNGFSVLGTGDMQFQRAGTQHPLVVGDYIVASHSGFNSTHTYATFDANTTHAGSGLIWYSSGETFVGGNTGNVSTWSSSDDRAASQALTGNSPITSHNYFGLTISGTWRVVVRGVWDTSLANKQAMFWARIS